MDDSSEVKVPVTNQQCPVYSTIYMDDDNNYELQQNRSQDVALEVEIGSDEIGLKCMFCPRTFTKPTGLRTHMSRCDFSRMNNIKERRAIIRKLKNNENPNKKNFKCKPCSKMFSKEKSFIKHNNDMHSKLPSIFACASCEVRCRSKAVLRKHMATHVKEKKVECDKCGTKFTRAYHLARHYKQSSCGGTPNALHECEVCNQWFTRKDNLVAHLRWHISKNKSIFKCKLCSCTCASFMSLIRHRMRLHEGNKFSCDTCGRVFVNRLCFTKHLLVHGEKNYICTECDFKCKSLEILRRHSLRHSSEKPFPCHLCSRSFIQQHELRAHLFRHTGRSDIVCPHCKECFPSKNTLTSHMTREHDVGQMLYCANEECKKKKPFSNKLSLRIHMKSHSENKPYKCGHCEKAFSLKSAWVSHELTHEWQRPRRCPYCNAGRAYIRGDLLLRHVRMKHAREYDDNLKHVRTVLGYDVERVGRLMKAESNGMLNMINALQDNKTEKHEHRADTETEGGEIDPLGESVVMTEEELAKNIRLMMESLINKETLECLGWPHSSVDMVLASVLKQCDVSVADANQFSRVACLRENTKQLFLRVIEDKTISRMLNTFTIDEVIRHVVSASQ